MSFFEAFSSEERLVAYCFAHSSGVSSPQTLRSSSSEPIFSIVYVVDLPSIQTDLLR